MSGNDFLHRFAGKDSHMTAAVKMISQEFRALAVSIINPEDPTVPPFYEIECTKG